MELWPRGHQNCLEECLEEIKSDYYCLSAPCCSFQVVKETLVRNQINFVSGSLLQLVQVHINTDVFHLKSLMNFSILPIKPEEPVDWDSKIVSSNQYCVLKLRVICY